MRALVRRLAPVAALVMVPLASATAQVPATPDSARPRPVTVREALPTLIDSVPPRVRGDSVRPTSPISPRGAFIRSLVLPGWGQARLGRNVTGGLFLAFEGLAAAMVWKSNWQVDIARTRGKYLASHLQEREDWIVLLVFNHLVAGAEAYVSANLFDFPPALSIRRLPGGTTLIGVTVPLR